jgi:membrane-associated protein
VLSWFIDLVLHLDRHLVEIVSQYHFWVYGILFAIVFAETGLVVTPILPGDSLLFATGALAAVDTSGTLSAPVISVLLPPITPSATLSDPPPSVANTGS